MGRRPGCLNETLFYVVDKKKTEMGNLYLSTLIYPRHVSIFLVCTPLRQERCAGALVLTRSLLATRGLAARCKQLAYERSVGRYRGSDSKMVLGSRRPWMMSYQSWSEDWRAQFQDESKVRALSGEKTGAMPSM